MWYSFKRLIRAAGMVIAITGVVYALSLCSGCAMSGTSDMPWNTPQSWEGSPSVPGFSPGAY